MSIKLIAILAAATSLAAASQAGAQPADPNATSVNELMVTGRVGPGTQMRARTVSYADLDLGAPSGAHALLVRINGAATQVCSPDPAPHGDLRDNADHRNCMNDAVARAVGDVDTPSLTDLYRAR